MGARLSLCIRGSANCNGPGYSHDSELDFGVYDVEKQFAKDVRVRLWDKRLNTQGVPRVIPGAELRDFLAAAKFWEDPDRFGLALENNRPNVNRLAPTKVIDLGTEETIDRIADKGNRVDIVLAEPHRVVLHLPAWPRAAHAPTAGMLPDLSTRR
jgi:hypothetical protein